jgi:hypothetical protein
MSVTVILNGYKRPHTLQEQYEAVKKQTYQDLKIMFWSNYDKSSHGLYPSEVINSCASSLCNVNFGVWARFAFALNAFTDYICVLDDDTIPGCKWVENCMNTMQTHRGLIGARGVKMIGDDYLNYPNCNYQGFSRGNTKIEQVDIIGHAWFFERDWLRYFWAEMPPVPLLYGGEDMHFSYVLQKHLNLNSYIPPQPEDDIELCGSTNPSKYGEDMNATSRTGSGHQQANAYWNFIISQGYKLVKDRT